MTEYQAGLTEAVNQIRKKADEYDAKRIKSIEEHHPRSEAKFERLRDLLLDQADCLEQQADRAMSQASTE